MTMSIDLLRNCLTKLLFMAVCVPALLFAGCGGGESGSVLMESAMPASDDLAGATNPALEIEQAGLAVQLDTNMGMIVIELDAEKAPLTVENFLNYVESGHYDDTVFHRVIDGFMIQGGGFDTDLTRKPALDPVANEADNGLKNDRYTIAMARTGDPQSATSQFFINVADNSFLDYRAPTVAGWGYAVFGRVTSGKAVVDQIAVTQTGAAGSFAQDVPLQSVVINSINQINK